MLNEHIPTGALFEKARLKTELTADAELHLANCTLCQDELSWMDVASGIDRHDPPQSLMNKVLEIGRNKSRLKQVRNVISALLTFDSLNLAPAAVRSGAPASRQMTFQAEEIEVGIWLRPLSEQKMTLSGQVLGSLSGPVQDASAYVDLVIEGDHIRSTSLSAWGEFIFADVPNTPYSLQVYFRDRVLKISDIPVRTA